MLRPPHPRPKEVISTVSCTELKRLNERICPLDTIMQIVTLCTCMLFILYYPYVFLSNRQETSESRNKLAKCQKRISRP